LFDLFRKDDRMLKARVASSSTRIKQITSQVKKTKRKKNFKKRANEDE